LATEHTRFINCMLNDTEKSQLKEVAKASIYHGFKFGSPLRVEPQRFSEMLQQIKASFVTLRRQNTLRGCVGTMDAYRSLVEDVAEHAYDAAFRDSRFDPLREEELEDLDIRISVLSPRQAMSVRSEQDLLSQLRPGTDGLVLELGSHCATFLPTVWEQLPNPADFLSQLKRKAGLNSKGWERGIRAYHYTSTEF
jgi:uncharacterized protein